MSDSWTQRWDDRFSGEDFAYGTQANPFFKEQLDLLDVGHLLLPAEGEGRHAVHAALNGWKVSAFDISKAGKEKALQLANQHQVSIDYQVGPIEEVSLPETHFDAMALIYAHFPPEIKSSYHKALDKYLKKGGVVIFEAFGKKHLDYKNSGKAVGGPGNIDALFSVEELKEDFINYEILQLAEQEIELNAGSFHSGIGSVVRFVGRKK